MNRGFRGVWTVLLLIVSATIFAGSKPATPKDEVVGCKIVVSRYGIARVYRNGIIECTPWRGSKKELRTRMYIQDVAVNDSGMFLILSDNGLFQVNLEKGLNSVHELVRFKKQQRYLQIIGVGPGGAWLLRPGVAIDLINHGRIEEHYRYDQLPAPAPVKGERRLSVPIPLFCGMVGGRPYLAMWYGHGSYGYLIQSPKSGGWQPHFLDGATALMPLVADGDHITELAVGHHVFSCKASAVIEGKQRSQRDGLAVRLGPHLYMTGMIGSQKVWYGIVVIDLAKGEVVFHRTTQDRVRKGVYIYKDKVWVWDLGWPGNPKLTSFDLPPRLLRRCEEPADCP